MGLRQSLQERVRRHQREIRREISRVDREIGKLRDKRRKLCLECKHYAEKGEMSTARSVLKQIVQSDKQTAIYQGIKLNCTGMGHQLGQVQSTTALQKTLLDSVRVMSAASRGASISAVNQSVAKYLRKMEETDLKLELMDDACTEAFGDADAEDELERKILDELQIDLKDSLPVAPSAETSCLQPKSKSTDEPIRVTEATVRDEPREPKEPRVETKPTSAEVYDGVASALQKRLDKLRK